MPADKPQLPPSRQDSQVSVVGDLAFGQSKLFKRFDNAAARNATGSVRASQSSLAAISTDSLLGGQSVVIEKSSELHDADDADDFDHHHEHRQAELAAPLAPQLQPPPARHRSITTGYIIPHWLSGSTLPSTRQQSIATDVSTTPSNKQQQHQQQPRGSSSSRKRSSTATDPNSVIYYTGNHHGHHGHHGGVGGNGDTFSSVILQNTSIFKRSSEGAAADTVTVLTRDYSLPDYPVEEGCFYPPPPPVRPLHGRASTVAGVVEHRLSDTADPHHPRHVSGGGGGRRIKKYSVTADMPRTLPALQQQHQQQGTGDYVKHPRGDSIATFLSGAGGLEPVKTAKPPTRHTISLQGLRVPRRWLSLRNVISFFNICILTVAVLVVVLVSYFAGVASTRSAINAMSNVTMNDVTLKLDDVLGNGQLVNHFTEAALTGPSNTMNDTRSNVRLFYAFMSVSKDSTDQIYAVAPDSSYVGVSTYRDSDGRLRPGQLQVRYLNKTSRPNMLVYAVKAGCTTNQSACYREAFLSTSTPLLNASYDVTTQPFYQQAVAKQRPGWSQTYLYSNGRSIGVTSFRPVLNAGGSLMFLAAADIWLNGLSDYLQEVCRLISAFDIQAVPSLFIFEPSGLLIASSDLGRIPIVTDGFGRQSVMQLTASIVETRAVTDYLLGQFGSLAAIQWPSDGSPFVFEDATSHVIIGHYSLADGDIDWIVAAYVPFAAFNGRLVSAHFIQVPAVSLAVLLVATLCSIVITRAIGRPLKHIAEEMLRVADLNLDDGDDLLNNSADYYTDNQPLDPHDSHSVRSRLRRLWRWISCGDVELLAFNDLKELQYLNSAMTAMKSGLKSFSKYVPLDVVTLLMKVKREAVLGVDEMELSIFFSDIVNFTSIAEAVTPKQLVDIMSEYLSQMSDIIQHNQGVVDKYIGDAVMAFWNAPIPVKEHANMSCYVALKSQEKLEELRQAWLAKGLPEIKARMGINTGKALVGNLGSSTRFNYTCLGDNVNLASRLEGVNKLYGTAIIISDSTYNAINHEFYLTRPLDVVAVKGKTKPSRIHELIGFRKRMSQSDISKIAIYERAFNELCEGNFTTAIEGLKTFLAAGYEHDIPALKHLNFCRAQVKSPVSRAASSAWSYQIHLDEK